MIIHKLLLPLTDVFDWLQSMWERSATQRSVALCILWVYLAALVMVEMKRMGFLPSWLDAITPKNHFFSIHLAFTLILGLEVMSLILVIPNSLSEAMGKQFQILTLILLRNAFEELSILPEPVSIAEDMWPAVIIGVSGVGAFCVFLCLGLYKHIARVHHFISSAELRMHYVMSKKILALTLFIIFMVIAVRDCTAFILSGENRNFFETVYTVLIFADITMVLIAQRYMPAFYAVFRNSGFVVGTLLMRLALSATPIWAPAIAISAALFVLAVTWGTNRFAPGR